MKKRLLVLLLTSMPIIAMNQYEARKPGMQTLETIKMTTVCCIRFCSYVDSCTGRKGLAVLSKQAQQYCSDSQPIPNSSYQMYCLTACCLPAPTIKNFGYCSQNNAQ